MATLSTSEGGSVTASGTKSTAGVAVTEVKGETNFTPKDRLEAGESLKAAEFLRSPNGLYRLVFQDDGNFCLYDEVRALWASGTSNRYSPPQKVLLEPNGDLKILSDRGSVEWNTDTGRRSGGTPLLVIQDDGNVTLTWNTETVWSTNTKQRQRKPRTKPDRLEVNQVLLKDQSLTSPSGVYKLIFQRDGNFVLYENTRVLWATTTEAFGSNDIRVELQEDANLVLYIDQRAKWSTNTQGRGNASSVLVLENDGNLTLSSDGKEIWSAGTRQVIYKPRPNLDRLEVGQALRAGDSLVSPNKKYKFIMQGDGNFVLYDEASKALWSANSNGSEKVIMQDDGNLVVSQKDGEVKWSSGTGGRGNATSVLILQDDGNAVVSSTGKRLWATSTQARLPDRLEAGQSLWAGNEIVSPNKEYRMVFQTDGNFVLRSGDKVLWASNTTLGAKPIRVTMQDDDNLIVGGRGSPHWTSSTRRRRGGGAAILYVRDSGDAIIKSDGLIIWSTNPKLIQPWQHLDTIPVPADSDRLVAGQYLKLGQSINSTNKQFAVTLQSDGQFIVRRNTTNDPVWTSNTSSNKVTKLQMNWNNNLVLYDVDGVELWASHTHEVTQFLGAIVHDDGNFSTYGHWTNWQTDTRFPVSKGATDKLQLGERFAADQALVNGEFKLTFTREGHFCSTKSGVSTYYYCDKDFSDVKYVVLNWSGELELKDGRNNVLEKYIPRKRRDGRRGPTMEFRLTDIGIGRIYDGEADLWSFDQLSSGTSPIRPGLAGRLDMNTRLVKGGEIRSVHGTYKLVMQHDGNLVIYHRSGDAVWGSGTNGKGDYVCMQPDGNLVICRGTGSSGTAVWSSGTGDRAQGRKTRFFVREGGKGVVFAGEEEIWST